MMKPFKAFHPFKLGVIMKAIGSWLPTQLFSDPLTKGAWYDPSDITRYMSSLGPELLNNGDFSSGSTGWTLSANAAVTNNALVITSSPQFEYFATSTPGFGTVGKYYSFTFTISNYSGGQVGLYFYNDTGHRFSSNGTYTVVLQKNDAGGIRLRSMAATAFSGTIDNISVRELTDISTATLFQDAAGTVPVTAVGQPVGLMLDKSKGLVLGSELKGNGTTGVLGSATAATYNTSTGVGTVSRVDGSNQSYVQFATTLASTYIVTIQNTSAASIFIRPTGFGTAVMTIAAGQTLTNYLSGNANYYVTSSGGTLSFTVVSVKELPGNHAFNSSGNSANFPVLSARYNLLTKTEDFSDAAWSTIGTVTRTSNYAVAPDGTTTAQRVVFSQNSSTDQFFQNVSVTSTTYSQGVWLKVPSGSALIKFGFYDGAIKTSALTLTTTWQYFTTTQLLTAGANVRGLWLYPDGVGYATEIYVWHPDVRVSNDALNQPAYQRVNTATDYDTVGFKPYLSFNGVNQWLQTNSIDFSYGDKMFVSAGVRKLSDAATGVLAELSANINSNARSFGVFAPVTASNNYSFSSRGSVAGSFADGAGYASPITNILSGIGNISGDQAILRVNGTQAAISTADQGTGNYGNYPLYIGSRGGASLWFNGRLYGLVVAGKQASASEITSCEKYLNQKTGAWS